MENIMLPQPHKILKVIQETSAEYTFRVAYDGTSKPGQFFQLSIPKVGEAPISVSGKGPGYIEFTIRKVGRLTEGVFRLKEGENLFMRGPYGTSFPVEDLKGKHLAVVVGATGMCPVRTILDHFAQHPEEVKSVHLIVGFKDPESMLFTEDIRRFQEAFHTTVTFDDAVVEGYETGLVTKFIKDIPFAEFGDDYNVIVVGSPVMMKFATLECIAQGVKPEKMWVSFARKMSCALGKCGHCKINETYVCLEGPVFSYEKAQALFD